MIFQVNEKVTMKQTDATSQTTIPLTKLRVTLTTTLRTEVYIEINEILLSLKIALKYIK